MIITYSQKFPDVEDNKIYGQLLEILGVAYWMSIRLLLSSDKECFIQGTFIVK